MKSIFSQEQIEYLKDNYDKMTYAEIANNLGFTERQVRGKINGLGLSKLRQFDKKYFKNIDDQHKAYWLGFIYADGYLVHNDKNRNYELGISIHYDDRYILNELNNHIGGIHKIVESIKHRKFNGYEYDSHVSTLRIYSKEIVCDLESKNILPNKTNKKQYPIVDQRYFWEFIRGFMDGDGCICLSKGRCSLSFTNSNDDFLNYLRDEIFKLTNIQGSIYKEKDKKYKLYYYNQEDLKIILNKIYENKDCEYLERKYKKYQSFIGSPS